MALQQYGSHGGCGSRKVRVAGKEAALVRGASEFNQSAPRNFYFLPSLL